MRERHSESDSPIYFSQNRRRSSVPCAIDSSDISRHITVNFNLRTQSPCLSIGISEKAVGVALADGNVQVFQPRRPNLLFRLGGTGNEDSAASGVRFFPRSESLVASYTDGIVRIFNYPSEELLNQIDLGAEALALDVGPGGAGFAVSGGDGSLRVFDGSTLKSLRCFKPKAQDASEFRRALALIFHNENEILTGGWDKIIRIYDLRAPDPVRIIYGPFIVGQGLDLREDGGLVLSGAWSRKDPLQLWDYGSGKLVKNVQNLLKIGEIPEESSSKARKNIKIPTRLFYSARFLTRDFIAIGGTQGNALSIVDINTEKVHSYIRGLENSVYDVTTSIGDGRTLGFVTGNEFALCQISF